MKPDDEWPWLKDDYWERGKRAERAKALGLIIFIAAIGWLALSFCQ